MNQQLLKNIRSLRTQKGFGQKELGKRIGMTQATFARFERGTRKTDHETLERIAKVFDMDLCALIHFHEGGGAHRPSEGSKLELDELMDQEKYLRRLNEQLTGQIRDKDRLISLLRG